MYNYDLNANDLHGQSEYKEEENYLAGQLKKYQLFHHEREAFKGAQVAPY